MVLCRCTHRLVWITGLFILLIMTVSGCSIAGPSSISRGRSDYNEVINRTDDEQLLMAIIRNRYGETFNTLAVRSVTANVHIKASAGINVGVGPSESYLGNLIPLSSGFAYEENPTISYMPVGGERYIQQLLSPIPLNLFLLFTHSVKHPALLFKMLITRANDLWNPVFLKSPSAKPDFRFNQFVELMTDLINAGVLDFVESPLENFKFVIILHDYAPAYTEKIEENLSLLNISMPEDRKADIVLPVSLSVGQPKWGGIAFVTRSVYDMMEIMSASIDVPEDHARSGLAVMYPTKGLWDNEVRIQHSGKRPKNASVAVKYRNSWFYIDETDQKTKLVFRLIRTLWSVRITETADKTHAVPVLTIPTR